MTIEKALEQYRFHCRMPELVKSMVAETMKDRLLTPEMKAKTRNRLQSWLLEAGQAVIAAQEAIKGIQDKNLRKLMIMYYMQGMDEYETAEALGVCRRTFCRWKEKALKEIRANAGGNFPAEE